MPPSFYFPVYNLKKWVGTSEGPRLVRGDLKRESGRANASMLSLTLSPAPQWSRGMFLFISQVSVFPKHEVGDRETDRERREMEMPTS